MKGFQVNDVVEVQLWDPYWEVGENPVVEAKILKKGRLGGLSAEVTKQLLRPNGELSIGHQFFIHTKDIVTLVGGLENE